MPLPAIIAGIGRGIAAGAKAAVSGGAALARGAAAAAGRAASSAGSLVASGGRAAAMELRAAPGEIGGGLKGLGQAAKAIGGNIGGYAAGIGRGGLAAAQSAFPAATNAATNAAQGIASGAGNVASSAASGAKSAASAAANAASSASKSATSAVQSASNSAVSSMQNLVNQAASSIRQAVQARIAGGTGGGGGPFAGAGAGTPGLPNPGGNNPPAGNNPPGGGGGRGRNRGGGGGGKGGPGGLPITVTAGDVADFGKAVVQAGIAIAKFPERLKNFGAAVLEARRDLGQLHSGVNNSFAVLDAERLGRNAKFAAGTAGQTSSLAKTQSRLEERLLPVQIAMSNIMSLILTKLEELTLNVIGTGQMLTTLLPPWSQAVLGGMKAIVKSLEANDLKESIKQSDAVQKELAGIAQRMMQRKSPPVGGGKPGGGI